VTFTINPGCPGRTDQYTFRTIYEPLAVVKENKYKILTATIVLVLLGLPACLPFTKPLWNLRIYRFLRLNRLEKFDIPVVVASPGSTGTTVDKPGAEDLRKLVRTSHRSPRIVAPVSRPAVLRASRPSETSPHLEFGSVAPSVINAG
jgi:hypothetical protein